MQRPSVLIIDDSEIERYILSHQLKKIGVSEIIQKSDGKSGLEFLKDSSQNPQQFGTHFPPAIIILDVNMPIMGGFEFLQKFAELKTQFDLDICQIVMYSGADDPVDKTRALQYDFVKDFLIKGESTIEELKTKIGTI
jgi:CheY-like chemotaxis protein